MKLRNKKTGEIKELNSIVLFNAFDENEMSDAADEFYSISALIDKWEDIKEPLIKDKKIRKAVRAWADAVDIKSCDYRNGRFYTAFYDLSVDETKLAIDVRNDYYTIAELCGEEE